MNVLALNSGSSSLKFAVIAADPPTDNKVRGSELFRGVIEPIGAEATLSFKNAPHSKQPMPVSGYADAAKKVIGKLRDKGFDPKSLDAVAVRVVHGGPDHSGPARVDEDLIAAIEKLEDLAPLHNQSSIAIIQAVRESPGGDLPLVAVFDSAFHHTIPEQARLYALPLELAQRHGIRRFGFHGTSHQYLMLRYAEMTGTPVEETNIITLHMGGGASATAILGGKSVDTSMGFTPIEGLIMGTRCGDIDAGIISYLARKEQVSIETVEDWLNKKSGLLGISGRSQDTRVLAQHEDTDRRSKLALDMFGYRARKYVGAYLAAMGGAAAIVFGGGIGENSPGVRARICEGLDWLGLNLDPERNATTLDREGRLTTDSSRLHAYVIPTDEELMMAHEALRCLSGAQSRSTRT